MIAPTGGSLFDAFNNIINLQWTREEVNIGKDLDVHFRLRIASHNYFRIHFTVLDSENF